MGAGVAVGGAVAVPVGVAMGEGVAVGVGGTVTDGRAGGSSAEIGVDVAARSDSVNGVDVATAPAPWSDPRVGIAVAGGAGVAVREGVGVRAGDSVGTEVRVGVGAAAGAGSATSVAVGGWVRPAAGGPADPDGYEEPGSRGNGHALSGAPRHASSTDVAPLPPFIGVSELNDFTSGWRSSRSRTTRLSTPVPLP